MTEHTLSRISFVVGVASLVRSVYFWRDAKSFPDLLVVAQPVRATLVSGKLGSGVVVSHKRQPVKGPITAVQIAVWNNGQKEIRETDILEPIKLSFDPPRKILTAEIKQLSRETTKFYLDESALAGGTVIIRWRILEHNDGAAIQIVYEGEEDAQLKATGSVTGQKEVKLVHAIHRKKDSTPRPKDTDSWVIHAIYHFVDNLGYLVIVSGFVGFVGVLTEQATMPTVRILGKGLRYLGFGVLALVGSVFVILVAFAGIGFIFFAPPTPPFPF